MQPRASDRTSPPAEELPGLLACRPFDEGKGDVAADRTGRTGTDRLHRATWVPGLRGNAVAFDWTDGHFDYSDAPGLQFPPGDPFTVSGWFQTGTTREVLVSQRRARGGSPDLDVHFERGVLSTTVRGDGNESARPARVDGPPAADARWHHLP